MVFLAIIISLICIGVPVALIYLLISNSKLRERVARLEKAFAASSTASKAPPATVTIARSTPAPINTAPLSQPAPTQARPMPPTQAQIPPEAYVLSSGKAKQLLDWVTQNWFYVVSAASLALAGIFLVQYGIEEGLLPPPVRVLAAVLFGLALIAGGEFIRRRFGDESSSSTAYLPSTFSGAGIVTLFGAVVSARGLYGLIDPNTAFAGMAVVGIGAVALGWFYGPFLAAIGIIGAMAAPFVVGGSSSDASWLFAYFAIVTITGLAIDTLRQWAWVSVLSLALGFGTATFLILFGPSGTSEAAFMLYCAVLTLAAIAIPVRQILPDHNGSALLLRNWDVRAKEAWPDFPTRLAGAALLAASALIWLTLLWQAPGDIVWLGCGLLTALILALLVWAQRAHAIAELVIIPSLALIAAIPLGATIWAQQVEAWRGPDGTMPLTVSIFVAIGIVISLLATWRSLKARDQRGGIFFAVFAALFAPAMAIAMEVFWQPGEAFASYGWALHALIIAVIMTAIALQFDKADGPNGRVRVSLAALSGIAAIAFAMVILFSTAALTVAISITVVAAAALDRKFNLPLMTGYIVVGIAAMSYRLVVDPGLYWAHSAPLAQVLLSHGGAVAAFAAAWYLMQNWNRRYADILLESAAFAAAGIFLSVMLYRAVVYWGGSAAADSHWSLGIGASTWAILGLAQLRRADAGGHFTALRHWLGGSFLVLSAMALLGAALGSNPLFGGAAVLGPPILTSLIPAYLLPATISGLGAWWLRQLPRNIRLVFAAISCALVALWLGLTIRHFWRGAGQMMLPGIDEAELYSYTVVLLLVGATLIYQSLARRSAVIRKAGLVVIGLAAAKVFLIDISGLDGLIRVFSLLLLGLSLAGLAWLNRWVALKSETREADTQSED